MENLQKTIELLRDVVSGVSTLQHTNIFSIYLFSVIIMDLESLEALLLLLDSSHVRSALELSRTMFDRTVNLKYILQDRSKVNDYIDYEKWHIYRHAKQLLKEDKNNSALKDDYVSKRKQWLLVRDRFIDENGEVFSTWNGLRLSKMAKLANLEGTYNSFYLYSSSFVHNSALASAASLKKTGKNTFAPVREPDQKEIERIILTVILFALESVEIASKEFSLGLEHKVAQIREDCIAKIKTSSI